MSIKETTLSLPQEFLARMKASLSDVFGTRLQGMVVYGSQARNETTPHSDIDILVLLSPPVSLGEDLRVIIDAIYPFQLEIDRPLHALPASAETYHAGEFALYRNAKREGVLV